MISVKSVKTYFGISTERIAIPLTSFLPGDVFVETDANETYQFNGMAWVQIAGSVSGSFLEIANNLSDLNNTATARTNLGLVSGGAGDIWVEKAGDVMSGGLVINNSEDDNDFRIAGDGVTNGVFYDGGNNTLGINTGLPNASYKLHVVSTGANSLFERNSSTDAAVNVLYNGDTTNGNNAIMGFSTDTSGTGATAQKSGGQVRLYFDEHNDSTFRTHFEFWNRQSGFSNKLTISNSVICEGTIGAFMPNVLTTTQRNALTAVNGMFIYNSTTGKFQGRAAGSWVDLH